MIDVPTEKLSFQLCGDKIEFNFPLPTALPVQTPPTLEVSLVSIA